MKPNSRKAFSLVEVLIALSVLGLLSFLAVASVNRVVSSTGEQKLASDAGTLNRAVMAFVASGGDVSGLRSAEEVLYALKQDSATASRTAGIGGAKIDSRLTFKLQSPEEAGSGAPRIYWDSGSSRFEVSHSGNNPGIIAFTYDEAAAEADYEAAERENAVLYSKESSWIWDYQEAPVVPPAGPSTIPVYEVSDSAPPAVPSPPPGPPVVTASLKPPVFSIPSGSFPITAFNLSLTLTDPNPAGTARIYYSIDYGNWFAYNGAIVVKPGMVVAAQAIPTSENYSSSSRAEHLYQLTRLPLVSPSLRLTSTEFNDDIDSIGVLITDSNAVGTSTIQYTLVEPGGITPSPATWPLYAGGFAVNAVDYPAGFTVKTYARAIDPAAYIDSPVTEKSAGADFLFPDAGITDVLYVIDASGSMLTPVGSTTRLALVKNALAAAIARLRPGARFNIATFAGGVVYSDGTGKLKEANRGNKEAAIKEIAGFTTANNTNYEAALRIPLSYSTKPAQVYFLTDGEPTMGGSYADEIASLAANGTVVNTIGVDLTEAGKALLKDIASQTGGSSRAISAN